MDQQIIFPSLFANKCITKTKQFFRGLEKDEIFFFFLQINDIIRTKQLKNIAFGIFVF